MFEQSLVNASGANARPWTVPAAAGGQALLVGVALLVPLVFPEVLPGVRLGPAPLSVRPLSVDPPPPMRASSSAPAPVNGLRLPRTNILMAPRAVPDHVVMLDEPGFAPSDAASTASGPFIPGVVPGLFTGAGNPAPPPAPPSPARKPDPEPVKTEPTRVQVGGDVKPPQLLHYVKPGYPPLARQARIQGTIRLAAVISLDGSITSIRLVSGHPLLVQAATDAVRQWRYRPTLLNGRPVEVALMLDVNFTLSSQ